MVRSVWVGVGKRFVIGESKSKFRFLISLYVRLQPLSDFSQSSSTVFVLCNLTSISSSVGTFVESFDLPVLAFTLNIQLFLDQRHAKKSTNDPSIIAITCSKILDTPRKISKKVCLCCGIVEFDSLGALTTGLFGDVLGLSSHTSALLLRKFLGVKAVIDLLKTTKTLA